MLIVVNTDKEPLMVIEAAIATLQAVVSAREIKQLGEAMERDKQPKILPEDRPDAGVELPTAAQAFAPSDPTRSAQTVVPDPAVAFGSAPTVPVPPPTVPVPPSASADLDADGIPWDMRIHASTKSKNKDGRWKARKGINDEAMVNRIKAELKAAVSFTPPVPLPAAPSAPITGATFPLGPSALAAGVVPPPALPMPPTPPAAGVATFFDLMNEITPLVGAGRLSQAAILAACQRANVEGLPTLAVASQANPALVPAIWADLKATLGLQ